MRTLLADGGELTTHPSTSSLARTTPSVSGRWTPAGDLPFPFVMLHGQEDGPVRLRDGRVLFAGGAGPRLRTL
ncbi:hypothetical protein, partial [Streptomyces venezuelae]